MKNQYLNISFYQMWYFIQTIEFGSYSKAAQKLNVTQSTLSKCIQGIEQNLNLKLFNREKNNLIPTESGLSLYRSWKKIIAEMDQSTENARRYMGGISGTLNIGVLDSHRSTAYLLEYIDVFREKYPNVHLAIESDGPERLHKKLEENELDIIFTVKYDMETIVWGTYDKMEIIKECPLVACMKKNHPLAWKECWEVEDLKNCNLIMISSLHVPSYNSMLVQLCMQNGFFPNIVYNAHSAHSQIYNLFEPNDVFICDKYHIDYDAEYIVSRPLKNTCSGVAMVWKNEDKGYLNEFVETVRGLP